MKNLKKLFLFCAVALCTYTATAQIQIGVCTKVNNARQARDAGAQFIECGVGNFLIPSNSEAEFEKNLALAKAAGIPIRSCNGFLPKEIKVTGPEADPEAALGWAETAFRRAQMAGISYIVFGSAGSRQIPEGFSREQGHKQFVDLLKKMGPIAAKYDVTVVLEPLNKKECNYLNTVGEGVEICKQVRHKNIMCLADIYHMLLEDESPEAIVQGKKYLRHVHVAEKQNRAAPGTFDQGMKPYFDALNRIGYQGGLSIECRWTDFDSQLKPALDYLHANTAK